MTEKLHFKNLVAILLLGFSSGLPLALTGTSLQAWYTTSGISYLAIGALSLVGQPYIYKFFWAPVLDRYIPPFLGRRRGWIFICQIPLLIGIIALAFGDPQTHPFLVACLALSIAFFSASQDIGIDAYRTDIASEQERGLAASLYNLGYRAAMMVSGGLCLVIAQFYGWRNAYLLMASFMVIGFFATFLGDEPVVNQKDIPHSLVEAIRGPFITFFKKPHLGMILVFILLYKFGDALSLSLLTPFLIRGLGFTLVTVGIINKGVGLFAGLLGIFAGGMVMIRVTLYRALFIFAILQIVAIGSLLLLSVVGKNLLILTICIAFDNLFNSMGSVALVAYMMSLCDSRYTATQFAFLSAFASMGRVFIGPLGGVIAQYFSWPIFFICAIIISLPSLYLLTRLKDSIGESSQ